MCGLSIFDVAYSVCHKHIWAFISCERDMYLYVSCIPMRWNAADKWVSPLLHTRRVCIQISGERGMSVACTNYWARQSGKHTFLSFSVISVFVHCTNKPIRINPSHSETESQSFRFSMKVFWLLGGGRTIFYGGPNPLSVGLFQICTLKPTWLIMFRVFRHFLQTGAGTQFWIRPQSLPATLSPFVCSFFILQRSDTCSHILINVIK
jgi:hypothetical protein